MNALVSLQTGSRIVEGEVLPRLETIEVECWRNPLSSSSEQHVYPAGLTVEQIVERAVLIRAVRKYALVYVTRPGSDDPPELIPQSQWAAVKPKAGCYVAIKIVPAGGGRKNLLTILLSLLVIVGAFYLAPVVAGSIGITSAAGTQVVFSALSTIGKAIVTALVPPPKINTSNGQISTERNYALTGTSNRAAPFQAVPRAYGRMRYYPPLASAPYTEIVGTQDTYLRMLFDFGPGPLKISNMKIGDTPIENFKDVTIEVGHVGDLSGNATPAGTFYAGFPDDRALTLFPNSMTQQNESVRMVKDTDIVRAFSPRIDQGMVVVSFPKGLFGISNSTSHPGAVGPYATVLFCWYREIGTSTWIPMIPLKEYAVRTAASTINILSDVSEGTFAHPVPANWDDAAYLAANPDVASNYTPPPAPEKTGIEAGNPSRPKGWLHYMHVGHMEGRTPTWINTTTAPFTIYEMIQRNFYYQFKTPKLDNTKEYEFRIKRPYGQQTSGGAKITYLDDIYLSGFQSVKVGSPTRGITGHALMALRIKSSDQLNGTLQNVSAQVEAALPTWNGSNWTSWQITRNPAWAALDVLRGSANARPLPDSRIDLATWLAFAQWCDGLNSKSNARAMFDGVFDAKTTVAEALRQILAPQRASFVMKDGKYSVIWDDAKTTPVQLFTPRNSSSFSSDKLYLTPPHALKIRFNNELKNYAEDELTVYADGYSESTATLFEQLEAFGIVRAEQAHWFGRYMIASTLLRPEIYTLDVDVEGLVCRRGDLVRVQHDVARWGIGSGRVISRTTSGGNVTTITVDETFLLEPGKSYSVRGRQPDGTLVMFSVNGVVAPTETATLTLTTPLATASCVDVGDLVAFGETTKETVQLLVRTIRRKDDLHATLELVDYSPDIFVSDTEAIPEFDTQSTWQGAGVNQSPPVPAIDRIVSDETAMIQTTSGWVEAFEVYLRSDSSVESGALRPDDYLELRYREIRTEPLTIETMTLEAGVGDWFSPTKKFLGNPSIVRVSDFVRTDAEFDIQVRRVSAIGNASDWSTAVRHTVVGRSTPPAEVTGLTTTIRPDDVLLYWSPNVERDIEGYELRVGADWDTATVVEKSPTTKTTQYVLAPRPAGQYSYLVRALDTFGLYSSTDAIAAFTILAPSQPSVSYTFEGTNAVLAWQDCQTSHRITTYKVKRGSDAPTETKTTTAQFPVNWVGSQSFEVWAIDVAGNESEHATVSVSVSGAAAPANFVHSFIGDAVQLSWAASSQGSIPIALYEVRYGGSDWSDATLLSKISGTALVTSASWSGTRTFRIRAVDIAGNYGAESTRNVIVTAPAAVSATSTLSAGQYTLTWTAPSSLLPVKEYEIRYGSDWSSGTLVATIQALNWSGNVTWNGTRSFWIVARTTTGLESTPAQIDLIVTPPNAPSLASGFIAGTLQLTWGVPSSALPIARYEIRYGGTDWASATFVTFTDNTTYQTTVNFGGARTYRVAAIDTGGNVGTAGTLSVSIVAPSEPQGIGGDVVDNNVLLRWSPPALGSLPIDYYEVRIGSTWAGAISLGRKDGTFTSHFQTASGNYTYWVAAFDTAGNEGAAASLAITVNQPPDYVLKANFNSSFSGTLTNAVLSGGAVFMPSVTGQTFEQHFTNESWSSPQDQITAGYPIYIQPTTTSDATYVETYDYGATIPSANITVTPTFETIAGTITLTGRVEVSSNGSSWTDVANPGWTGFASSFRYIRFTVKAVGSARTAVGRLSALNVRIDLKEISESGVATCNSGDSGGTTVTFTRTFIDVDSITVTPRSTTACYAVVDFTDTPNPTGFKILVFDINGNRVTKDVGWQCTGV